MTSFVQQPSLCRLPASRAVAPTDPLRNYQVQMDGDLLDEGGQLLDWLIGFAFDTLDALCLDLRVVDVHPSTCSQFAASKDWNAGVR